MNYQLKQAKIESAKDMTREDHPKNTFQCRVLPDMEDINETDLLPYYASFFGGEDLGYKKDDIVWALTTEDFQIGFILGFAQPVTGSVIKSFLDEINEAEEAAGYRKSSFSDLHIERMAGSSINFSNRETGQSGVIYPTRVVYLYGADGSFWVKNPGYAMYISAKGDLRAQGTTRSETFTGKVKLDAPTIEENTSGKYTNVTGSMKENISGSHQMVVAGNDAEYISGKKNTLIAQGKEETIGLEGETKKIIAGGSNTTIAAGGYSVTVLAGTANITTAAGVITLTAGGGITITSAVNISLTAPSLFLNTALLRFPSGVTAPSPVPGPACALPFCLLTGVPHSGSITVGV